MTASTAAALDQAVAQLRAGDPSGAEQTLRLRLADQPSDIAVLAKLADLLAAGGRDAEALAFYGRALALSPRADNVRLAMALALTRERRFDLALEHIEKLGPDSRSRFTARATEAAILGALGRHDRELAAYEDLLVAFPNGENAWLNYGNALKTVGRTEDAIVALRHAIRLRRTFGQAYWALANLKTFRFDGSDVAAMRRALKAPLSDTDAFHFHFALGKALEDQGKAEASFRHYAAGNRIRSSQVLRSQMVVTPRVDAAIKVFTSDFFDKRAGSGCREPGPIFVVGLQRSGSTLVEQILASHPQIEGIPELRVVDEMWDLVRSRDSGGDAFAALHALSNDDLRELGTEYLRRSRQFRRTAKPLFVDKQAGNWLNTGFIRLILPDAPIVDTRRHPMACGFSNFRQHFDVGVLFSYDLDAIGRCYADYLRLMNHFDAVLPDAIHHVINERLIDDPEGEVRKLLDHVGVAFDPACLEFHRSTRAVHSASSEQVRRPINRDGVDYWKRFEPWLGPLKLALGDALDRWADTGIEELAPGRQRS